MTNLFAFYSIDMVLRVTQTCTCTFFIKLTHHQHVTKTDNISKVSNEINFIVSDLLIFNSSQKTNRTIQARIRVGSEMGIFKTLAKYIAARTEYLDVVIDDSSYQVVNNQAIYCRLRF